MSNLRKKERGSTNNYFLVFEIDSGDIIGRLLNLTEDGLMLLSDDPVDADIEYKCRMILPGTIVGCQEIYFDIKSRWCNKNKRADWYETGYQITKKSETCQKVLNALIKDWMNYKKNDIEANY